MVTVYKRDQAKKWDLSRGCVAKSFRYEDAWEEEDKIAPGFGDFMFMQSQFKQRHGLVRQVS